MRKMTWAILAWTGLCVVWLIGGARNVSSGQDQAVQDCMSGGFNTAQDCQTFYHAGAGIGFGLVFGVWFVGFIVLAIIWAMTRPKPEPQIVIVQKSDETFTAEQVQEQIAAAMASAGQGGTIH